MRYSRQRNLILNIVKSNPVHPTAEWIHEKAREELPGIGLATVYRNLNALAANGEIQRIPSIGGVDRFDGNNREHYHMKCRRCGSLTDLSAKSRETYEQLGEMIRNAFRVDMKDVYISTTLLEGICERCKDDSPGNVKKVNGGN